MKKLLKILLYYALFPFIANLAGLALDFCGLASVGLIAMPLLVCAIYILARNKLDTDLAMKTNGWAAIILLVCFTVMMLIVSGNVDSRLMIRFCWLIVPFAPIILGHMLMRQNLLLFATAILTYAAAFAVLAFYEKIRIRKILIPLAAAVVCVGLSTYLYLNRPSVKYGGHGFDYMNGYSSTDFTDYTVYAGHSRLAELDHEPSFTIDNEAEMPVLDGAEACYPLYAAFAKAVYKDIDKIETAALDADERYHNGRIVTFTNTIYGFDRLVLNGADAEKYGSGVDMFFGARPSADQLNMAKEFNVDLEITPIGREAFVFFVEKDNPVDGLTADQLRAVYHGDVTDWSELGGRKQEILAFQRPQNSGSQTMMEYFMGDTSLKEPQTYEMTDAMAGIIRKVAQYANERGALGYSFRYFLEELNQEKGVKMLSVDGVYPSLENIENGTYPLVVDVCLITRKDDPNPNVQKMIDFILSEDGQAIVRKTGYAGAAK